MEQFVNNANSTLSVAANSSQTSITVTSAVPFPSVGNFRVIVDTEIFVVSAVSGSVFTVARGAESTTAAAHSLGATVTAILTSGGLTAGIIDPNQTSLSGTTSGNVISSMPIQANTYKKFVAFFNAYENANLTVAQTISYPTAFTQTPVITINIDPQCTTNTTVLTLPIGMIATISGFVIVEGY